MRWLVIGSLVFLLIALSCLAVFAWGYNKAVALDEKVRSAWAQVDNQLKRRFDLVPNLVDSVKAQAARQQEALDHLRDCQRAFAEAQTVQDKARAATQLQGAITRLMRLQEGDPAARADPAFLALQDQLEGAENRIAVERKRYNETVRELNLFAREFLGRYFCRWAGVNPGAYFEIPDEEKQPPKLDLQP